MKLDEQKIRELSAMSDDELWRTIRDMLAQHGMHLPDKQPTHEDMMRLRAAFQGAKGIRPLEGMRLMNEYRQKYMK